MMLFNFLFKALQTQKSQPNHILFPKLSPQYLPNSNQQQYLKSQAPTSQQKLYSQSRHTPKSLLLHENQNTSAHKKRRELQGDSPTKFFVPSTETLYSYSVVLLPPVLQVNPLLWKYFLARHTRICLAGNSCL